MVDMKLNVYRAINGYGIGSIDNANVGAWIRFSNFHHEFWCKHFTPNTDNPRDIAYTIAATRFHEMWHNACTNDSVINVIFDFACDLYHTFKQYDANGDDVYSRAFDIMRDEILQTFIETFGITYGVTE